MSTPVSEPPALGDKGDSQELPHKEIMAIMFGLMAAMFLAALDQTIVSTALKTIAGDFHAFNEIPWVITSYMLFATASTPLYGKISDLLGRRPVFLFSIGVFLLGSILAGLSQNMTQLIIFRGVQGLGAGGLMPMAFTIISDIVPPRDRGKYQGYFGAVFGLSSVVGPLLGGWFTDSLNWRWCFYINVPVGIVAVYLVIRHLNLPHTKRKVRIDYIGATLLVAAVSTLLLALEFGNTDGWTSPLILTYFGIALVSTVVFVWWETRVDEPILPLSIFRNSVVSTTSAVGFVVGFGMFGAIIYVSQYLQIIKGLTATEAGLAIIPMVVGIMGTSITSGQLISKLGKYKGFILAGTLILIAAMFLLGTVGRNTSMWTFSLYMFILGCGLGLCMQNLVLAGQNGAPIEQLGVVTSSQTFIRQLGGTIGIAIFGSILNGQFIKSVKEPLASAKPSIDAMRAQAQQLVDAAAAGHLPAGVTPEQVAGAKQLLAVPDLTPSLLQKMLADSETIREIGKVSKPLENGIYDAFIDAMQMVYHWALPIMAIGFVIALFIKQLPMRTDSAHAERMRAAQAEAMAG